MALVELVKIEVDALDLNKILDGYAAVHSYSSVGGETKSQFLKKELIAYIKQGIGVNNAQPTVNSTIASSIAEITAIALL